MKANAAATILPSRNKFPAHFKGGGQDFEVTFRELGFLDLQLATNHAAELVAKHVTGLGMKDMPGYQPPIPLPPVNGYPLSASPDSFGVAAILYYAQTDCSPDDRYSTIEWLQFCANDELALQVMKYSYEISKNVGEVQDEKKDSVEASLTSADLVEPLITLNS